MDHFSTTYRVRSLGKTADIVMSILAVAVFSASSFFLISVVANRLIGVIAGALTLVGVTAYMVYYFRADMIVVDAERMVIHAILGRPSIALRDVERIEVIPGPRLRVNIGEASPGSRWGDIHFKSQLGRRIHITLRDGTVWVLVAREEDAFVEHVRREVGRIRWREG